MKLKIVSDLHIEFLGKAIHEAFHDVYGKYLTNHEQADTLIIAGDLAPASMLPHLHVYLAQYIKQYKHVIYIAGNHEYYGVTLLQGNTFCQSFADRYPNMHYLDCTAVELDGINFIGAPLWFPKPSPVEALRLQGMLNDLHMIHDLKGFIDIDVQWSLAVEAIQYHAKPDMKNILITHHAPTERISNELGYSSSVGFGAELPFDTSNITAMICGHIHTRGVFQTSQGNHVHVNAFGYFGHQELNDLPLCIEV